MMLTLYFSHSRLLRAFGDRGTSRYKVLCHIGNGKIKSYKFNTLLPAHQALYNKYHTPTLRIRVDVYNRQSSKWKSLFSFLVYGAPTEL